MKKTSAPKKTVKKAPKAVAKASVKSVLTVTDIAVSQLKKLSKEAKKTGYAVKLDLLPGGCSGFQYFMDFQKAADKGDTEFVFDGVKILVHESVMDFLKGTTLDYTESLTGSGFVFNNPNVQSSCHCGKSVC